MRFAGLLSTCSAAVLCVIAENAVLGHDPDTVLPRFERREVELAVRDFTLTDQDGRQLAFKHLSGKVVVLGFGYTTCPDVCPLMTATMLSVQRTIPENQKGSVYFLTVTTDPEIDTPAVLGAYARRYGADLSNWAFLTGPPSALKRVWENFGLRPVKKARGLVEHAPLTVLIDRQGIARLAYIGGSPEARVMRRDVAELLQRRS
ncbi:MAG TPA: SCO family protein [Candidatus Eisenbacteria bacterium]|nr:SCO family protein [Candidatus Eisenbacteria bacterium]